MQRELGEAYKTALWQVYDGRVPRTADLVMYWFEKARATIDTKRVKRVGLLGTNTIRQGGSAAILKRIKETGDIFFAYTDVVWPLPGADLRVVLIGFDDGSEKERRLNGTPVAQIGTDLMEKVSFDAVVPLIENQNICFRSGEKNGPFDIPEEIAQQMLRATNTSGRCNSDVIHPYFNAMDVVRRPRQMWLIDFGEMALSEAELYEAPSQYVREHVKPIRDTNNRKRRREIWWQHGEVMPRMRRSVASLQRFIVTPLVSKYRLFLWLDGHFRADVRLVVIAREDDYFFGVLHSRPHEIWALRLATLHGKGNDPTYNVTRCFDTYPFPFPPGQEDQFDPKVQAIAEAARELVRLRDEWLNPVEVMGVNLKERTLTNLYNKRPDWLDQAHKRLDAAVFDAYGWPHDLSDDEILTRLLKLNLERAAGQGEVAEAESDSEE
jgi:hypothetical protein